ncbi:urease accessory protein UreD [Nannizzia gypsea CBS 118893]|uniref:Urease accessory protein UreD n=1 Tax=Arthroderma gypseum (strain ATCC MYA-4604 / CBS 118893) TaxID=535722 RepID=E4UVW8_ARTGP|nr:urease accessory protein UreD [Nannizzia gypsea CBS 118893]EFR02445.1 urease accessory protein UreD [Nannizzia gypsea CBS 118893]
MPILNSPFAPSAFTNRSGRGEVVLTVLPPANPSLSTVSYNYPLKLLSRIPEGELKSKYPATATPPLHLYLLTYGGGLLPGDHIDVSVTIKPRGRLVVTTPQGSTKIYKTEAQGGRKRPIPKTDSDRSKQTLKVQLGRESGLCLLPDPSVPFADSRYDQFQTFTLLHGDHSKAAGVPRGEGVTKPAHKGSLCVLDWVTEGRSARGESWSFDSWTGRNEVWLEDCKTGKRRLLLRDAVILNNDAAARQPEIGNSDSPAQGHLPSTQSQTSVRSRTHPHGILGTLIIHGPLFESLADFFMEAFTSQPRIGGQNWSSSSMYYPTHTNERINKSEEDDDHSNATKASKMHHGDVTWTAARVRNGFVLVKFAAPDFESARDWLGQMLRAEGSIQREFGEEAFGSL